MLRRVIVGLVVLAVVVAGAVGGLYYQRLREPFQAYRGAPQYVELAPGDSTQAIGRKLVESGVVRDRWLFRLALWQSGAARRLRAGEYRFDEPMTVLEVVGKLVRGDVYLRRLTFPEGLTIREMARIYQAQGFGPAADFTAAAGERVGLVGDLDPSARDLEGYLFPDTYALPRHAGAADLVGMMVARFRRTFAPLAEEVRARGMTPRQAVTLASLVEKETARADERPTVAGVYLRRLQTGMALQCDPTVIYALEAAGRYRDNLTRENMTIDSPYNTYRYAGLPPGPIASPSRLSLEAAARPDATDYLYFVSRNDGSHVFARTLAEHNRNVARYQVQYFRQKH
jgi:UPF0755 protein